jgi:hypothetical protein
MALIKKAKPADAVEETEPDAPPVDESTRVADAPEAVAEAENADAATMSALAAVPADPVEAEASGNGADSLLDMFATVGIETVDRTALLNLAGEVPIEDLVSELNLVAAALGVVQAEHDARAAEHEQLAA